MQKRDFTGAAKVLVPGRDVACRSPRDSPLEGTGFEPSVPRQEKWSMPNSSDKTLVGLAERHSYFVL